MRRRWAAVLTAVAAALALVLAAPPHKWDIVVALDDRILFVDTAVQNSIHYDRLFNSIKAIAYDHAYDTLFISDKINSSCTFIYGLNLKEFANSPPSSCDLQKVAALPFEVHKMTYDPVTSTFFLSNAKLIYSLAYVRHADSQAPANIIYEITNGSTICEMTVDSCHSMLYAVSGKTIIRYDMKNHTFDTVINDTNIDFITGIAVDLASEKFYWMDDKSDAYYTFHSSNLDGSDARMIFEEKDNTPGNIAYYDNSVVWFEHNGKSLWQYTVSGEIAPSHSRKIFSGLDGYPIGIVRYMNITTLLDSNVKCDNLKDVSIKSRQEINRTKSSNQLPCKNGGIPDGSSCNCTEEYEGSFCEYHKCHNYCFNGGCTITSGRAVCRCYPGYKGNRCTTQEPCINFCKNNGTCNYTFNGIICKCGMGFKGNNCELEITTTTTEKTNIEEKLNLSNSIIERNSILDQNTTKTELIMPDYVVENGRNVYVIPVFCSIILLLVFIIFGLVYRLIYLRRNPRIIKKIIGKRAANPFPKKIRNGCDVPIEDCCNMNLCEMPCYEPDEYYCERRQRTDSDKIDLINDHASVPS